mmetsp:Transcript_14297/g.21000  ORF Transcript_14297/g.21000 Transcript_14297/m.21000 type:complete len:253 (-) Transcript_14297:502-1260(-)
MTIKMGGVKAGGTVRGGGGICPAKKHAKFFDVNLAEAQDLARVAAGKARSLTKVPENSRLEATGLRIQGMIDESLQVRASVAAVWSEKSNTKFSPIRPVELQKRTKAEWNGIHVRISDGQQLWVRVQSRKAEDAAWDNLVEITIDPLKAFKVEDQDVVWYPTQIEPKDGLPALTVWMELSLMQFTAKIMEQIDANGIVMKQRKKIKSKFKHRRRTLEEINEEEALLEGLLEEADTMTLHGKKGREKGGDHDI